MIPQAQDSRTFLMHARKVRDERGSAGIELLITATASMALVLIVVAAGRTVDGKAQANDAAYAAARAASLVSDSAQAVTVGRRAAADALAERGKSCQNLMVSFAGSDFNPGGQVIAEVRCTMSLADTGSLGRALGLKPSTAFSERAVVPIENYRD
ncbi:MAG: ATP/GTP-binding protein [Nocardioidaceae bacterium]|nr:MAG: ATP/GTP-binding protein [Nocardioidaceae bacterium]